MSALKNTPWRVVEDQKFPWEIHVKDATGETLFSERRYAYSTRQKTLEDLYEAVGFPAKEIDVVAASVKQQIERIRATVDAVNSAATNDATIAELVAILVQTRIIIADGAMTGFLPLDGDWAERLFVNQNEISRAIKANAAAGVAV